MKSTVEEIRARFDGDVERFSNLETGQAATMDAPLAMDLICRAAATATPHARHVVDLGCGAGNYTLKLLQFLPHVSVTLVDLSRPMLDRADQRIAAASAGGARAVKTIQSDVRDLRLAPASCDIILAASVLHHLREESQWRQVFRFCYEALAPGGSFWIFDLIEHTSPGIQAMMREQFGKYLESLKGADYRRHVFDYIEREDTPRPLVSQLELLREAGFSAVEVLHVNTLFAAFGGRKADGGS